MVVIRWKSTVVAMAAVLGFTIVGGVQSRLRSTISETAVQDTGNDSDSDGDDLPRRRLSVDEVFRDLQEDEPIKALVGYRSESGRQHIHELASHGIKHAHSFDSVGAVAVTLTKSELLSLELNPDIEYIEKDGLLYPMHSNVNINNGSTRRNNERQLQDDVDEPEKVPYGIKMIQANRRYPISQSRSSANLCASEDSFKIAMIDSGVYGDHPDLPCSPPNDPQCVGREFGSVPPWYQDLRGHGQCIARYDWCIARQFDFYRIANAALCLSNV